MSRQNTFSITKKSSKGTRANLILCLGGQWCFQGFMKYSDSSDFSVFISQTSHRHAEMQLRVCAQDFQNLKMIILEISGENAKIIKFLPFSFLKK